MWNPTIPQVFYNYCKTSSQVHVHFSSKPITEKQTLVYQRILQQKLESNSTRQQAMAQFGRLERRRYTSSRYHKVISQQIERRTHEMSSGFVSRLQQMIDSPRPESSINSVILHSKSIGCFLAGVSIHSVMKFGFHSQRFHCFGQ